MPNPTTNPTALEEASFNGHESIVQQLLQHGAGERGDALYATSGGGHERMLWLLQSQGDDLNW